jgi:Fe-S-cluster-containing dehydrogenase component
MTSLPKDRGAKRLGLVIDLDICVGCHACAVACKEWNSGGHAAPLTDFLPYGADPDGVWFNRVHSFETTGMYGETGTVHFPRSCLHCEKPACVEVCPTGASFKRAEDGIVLVAEDLCIGCKLCSWACPYGAREYDANEGVMKKCTLCIDRIYNENLDVAERVPACVSCCPVNARHFGDLGDPESDVSRRVAERDSTDLMYGLDYKPVNKYLMPRARRNRVTYPGTSHGPEPIVQADESGSTLHPFLRWVDRMLSD